MLEIHVAGPFTGKTTGLVEWAKSAPPHIRRIIVTPTQQQAQLIKDRYDVEAMTVTGLPQKLQGKLNIELGIDGLEPVLYHLIGHRVERATAMCGLKPTGNLERGSKKNSRV